MVSFETKRDKPVMPQTLCPGREFCMSNWQSSGGNNKFNHKVHKEGLKVRKEIITYSLRCLWKKIEFNHKVHKDELKVFKEISFHSLVYFEKKLSGLRG